MVACGGVPVEPSPPPPPGDRDAVVFGAEAWRVPGTVDFIGFAGDDTIVATQGGTVVRFGPDGARRVIAEGVLDDITGFALHDGALVLAGGRALRVELATGGAQPVALGGAVRALALAGGRAVVGEGGEAPLRVVEVARPEAAIALEHSRGFGSPAIAGDWVIAGRSRRAVGVWELATGKRHRVFALGDSAVYALAPDHRLIATGTFHEAGAWAVDVHRVDDGARTATIRSACHPSAAAFSPAGDRLAIACKEEVRVVAVPGGEAIATLPGPGAYVRALAWSPAGDRLALGGNDHVLHVWRTDPWRPLSQVTGSRGDVDALAVSGRFLVTHSWGDQSAWLWATDQRQPAVELGGPGREIMAIAAAGDEILVAVTHTSGGERRASIERWRGATRVAHAPLTGRWGSPLVRAVGALDGGGAWLTAEGRVTVLDAALRPRWTSPAATDTDDPTVLGDGEAGATRTGRRIVLRAEGRLTVIAGDERRVVASQPFASCAATPPAVSPGGHRAALLGLDGITVIDAATAEVVASLAIATEPDAARAITWPTDDELVALAGDALVAWRPAAGAAVTLPAPNAVAVALDGDRIYLGRNDGTVARRAWSALRATARPFPLAPVAGCAPEGGSLFGVFGFGDDGRRGRLDDAGAYDEPDPAPPELDDLAPD